MKFKSIFSEAYDPWAAYKPIPNHHPITSLTHEVLSSHNPKTTSFDDVGDGEQSIHYTEGPEHTTEEAAAHHMQALHDAVTSIGWKHVGSHRPNIEEDPQRTQDYRHPDLPHHSLYIQRNGHPAYKVDAGMAMHKFPTPYKIPTYPDRPPEEHEHE